jgi:sodium-dependent dicarboxylate transporter 2/3/5
MRNTEDSKNVPYVKLIALVSGPLCFFLFEVLKTDMLDDKAWHVLAIASWMVIWWVFEAVPIFVTALLPIVLFPTTGIFKLADATTPYASPIIFLFMGGFMLALAMEKHHLHKRIALNLIRLTGTKSDAIILGFILATACLSMWISNTATAVMMLPIGLSVVRLLEQSVPASRAFQNFKLVIFLGIAYAANIGGIATIIGTPPNVVLLGYVNSLLSSNISFLEWFVFALPVVILLLFLMFILLTKVLYPNRLGDLKTTAVFLEKEIEELGEWTREERLVAIIFTATALAWVFKVQINDLLGEDLLNDTVTAMAGGIATFLVPIDSKGKMLMKWDTMKELPWGILLLFGGGMCLAKAMEAAGFVDLIGEKIAHFDTLNWGVIAFGLILLSLFLTEIMSNVALTTIAIPMVMSIATGLQISPYYLAIPVAMASSCAFMMPISTPPNAIVFASGYIDMKSMLKAGLILNLLSVLILSLLAYFILPLLF